MWSRQLNRKNSLKKLKNIPFIITVFVDLIIIISIFFLMNYVQTLLQSDVKINLTEIVTQNKDVITSKIKMEVNNLYLVGEQFSDRLSNSDSSNLDPESLRNTFLNYAKSKDDNSIYFAPIDGTAILPTGQELDISGRKYFRLSIEGIQNISDKIVSRENGEEVFVISVPVRYKGEIIGTILKQYSPKAMYDICSISLFSEQGEMFIINSEGYVLVSSQNNLYDRESDNYFRMLYSNNPDASKTIETDIKNKVSGFIETSINGKKFFSAYTPIDDIYDWYLISSVSTSAVSLNANIVIKMFYVILFAVALLFSFSTIYYLKLKNKQQKKIEDIAFVDMITNGDSYSKFIFDIQELFHKDINKKYFIFAFDIDSFKYINNYYGFDTGDKILKTIYKYFSEKLTEIERIARVYSDHFVMLLEDTSIEKLYDFFQSELDIEGISVYLSGGLYEIDDIDESINLMVDKANLAVQKVKGIRDKNIQVYSNDFDAQMILNEQIKREVEQALLNDEIVPYFQPKIDVNTDELVGAEALARWINKDGKLIPPNDFIPICEKTGLIIHVDLVIFEKTLKFIKENLDNNIKCAPISVNFSRMHLLNKDFIGNLISLIKKYSIPSHLIEIELTETIIFDNYNIIEDFINKLHSFGFKISMDDFGSGYSSLQMLKDVNIDILKIDRGFLKETANSEKQKIIFSTISDMAKKLNIKVVVEGVENLDNVELMKEFGCSIAQGYFYSKPISKDEFNKIYKEGKIL